MRLAALTSLVVAILLIASAPTPAAEFPLKEGDVWVMAGDSITAQHLHSNYFEAFCYARYPKMNFAFRNSGVGGHTIPSTMARFDYDIAAWKPTVVSVELGMNDKGGTTTDQFITNMGKMTEMTRGIKARPIIFSASPVNNGETMKSLNGNKRLDEYAVALKAYSAKEQIPYADQFHALVDVWGKNKPRENLANAMSALHVLSTDDKLAGIEHLRAFIAAQEKDPNKPVSMTGDAVHPGAPGQLMMAAALLKELGANPNVSSATIDAAGKLVEAKGCTIEGIKAEDGKLTFERLDECLPFPIPDEARAVLALDPTILELSQYTLKVTGLKGDTYQLKVNGTALGTVNAKELEKGINLTDFATGPIAAQGKVVLAAVAAKEGIVGNFRNESKAAHAKDAAPELKTKLAERLKEVEAADAKIRSAAKPQKLTFELSPSK